MAASGGNFDSFGKKAVNSLLESKGVVPLGLPDDTFLPPEPNVPSPAPPGSLVFACYKVATLSLCRGFGYSCAAFHTAFVNASPPMQGSSVEPGLRTNYIPKV
jgi:hypothetical protein